MGIVSIEETKESGGFQWAPEGRHYNLELRVRTDSPAVGPKAVVEAADIGLGAYYRFPLFAPTETDLAAILTGVTVDKEGDDGLSWRVRMTFGPRQAQPQQGGNSLTINPLLTPPTVRWHSERMEIACTYDRDGKIIANVIGDPFDPPLTRPYTIPIVTIQRTLAEFDPSWIFGFQDHVNDGDWMGFPAGTVLCKELTGDRTWNNDFGWLWQQTLVFGFRPIRASTDGNLIEAGWSELILNTGLREKVAGVIRKVVDDDGSPVSTPVPLTSKGKYDPEDEQGFLQFDLYPTADFAFFELPEDLFTISGGV